MPCRWKDGGWPDFTGRALFRRRFGYPGRLDPTDRVWLTFAGVAGAAEVSLNDRFLGRRDGAQGPFEFEITPLLAARNKLEVTVEELSGNGGLRGEVAMEVRCTAFLRPVRVWADLSSALPALHVTGEVVGTCERPLDLYVLLDGHTVAYTTVKALPEGRSFQLIAQVAEGFNPAEGRLHEVRVELVNGATVWYRIEQPFSFLEKTSPRDFGGREHRENTS
jgi:hypothetical protein